MSEQRSSGSMPFVAGVVVDGKYRLERPIARGGMGFVVLGRHVQLDQPVALKFMHAWLARTVPKGAARFLNEARAAACLRSDYVARVSDTGTFQGSPYMVMEYLEGEDLESLLARQPVLPIALAVRYALQASEGLGEAHAAGIVHRDLKPANLFLARRSDGSVRVKLLDFGISKMVGGVSGPNPGWDAADSPEVAEMNAAVCGSPLYMAPEQMVSPSKTDTRTDIWALGVVLYEMLAGVRPFVGSSLAELCTQVVDSRPDSLRALRPEVPVVLESAVMQCLQKDPDRRFQNISALAHALAGSGAGATKAAAARIDRIMQGRSLRPGPSPSTRPDPAVPVPQGPLTQTSFNRAVDGVAGLMNLAAREPPIAEAEATPPPVASPLVEIADDAWRRPGLAARILMLGARLKGVLAARRRGRARAYGDLGATGVSLLNRARAVKRRRTALLLASAGGMALAFFFVAREPTQGVTGTSGPPPAPSALTLPAPPPKEARTRPWAPATTPAAPAPPASPVVEGRANASSPAPTRAPVIARAEPASAAPVVASAEPLAPAAEPTSAPVAATARPRAVAAARGPGVATLAAPIGTNGFGGRE
jgi:serine/threonine protein kinase